MLNEKLKRHMADLMLSHMRSLLSYIKSLTRAMHKKVIVYENLNNSLFLPL